MVGIVSYGAYLPYFRLSRAEMGKAFQNPSIPGERTVANIDEDSITMGVESALDCIKGFDVKKIDGLYFATTTAPYKEKQCADVIAEAIDMRKDIQTADFTNSIRSSTIALNLAIECIKSGKANSILVVSSDCRPAEPEIMMEQLFGDGAGAILVGNENVIAEIEGYVSYSDNYVGPWRRQEDDYVRYFEPKLDVNFGYNENIKKAILGAFKEFNIKAEEVNKVILPTPDPRANVSLAKSLGFDPIKVQDAYFFTVGNTGTPLAFMMLVGALETSKPEEKILLANYGDGGDAFLFKVTENISKLSSRKGMKANLKNKKLLPHYGLFLKNKKLLNRDRYKPKSSTVTYWRDRESIVSLSGNKCKQCGTVQYPLGRVCFECREKDNFERVPLSKRGKVYTFTLDHLIHGDYSEIPVPRIIIELDGGGKIFLEMTDCDPNEVKIDMPVELTFRKIHEGADFINYYWKCKPVRE